jgi:hypothetical protein
VLEEAQRAAGPQYPADLGERGVGVGDGAQHEGDHGGVVAGVGGGQRVGRAAGDFDGNGHGPGGGGGECAQPRFGLDRQHPGHGCGVLAEAGPGAGADVDDFPGQAGEQVRAAPGDPACFQCPAHRREGTGEERVAQRGRHQRLLT